eukprot:359833-Chlamydomonas_euryale.AAC.4
MHSAMTAASSHAPVCTAHAACMPEPTARNTSSSVRDASCAPTVMTACAALGPSLSRRSATTLLVRRASSSTYAMRYNATPAHTYSTTATGSMAPGPRAAAPSAATTPCAAPETARQRMTGLRTVFGTADAADATARSGCATRKDMQYATAK